MEVVHAAELDALVEGAGGKSAGVDRVYDARDLECGLVQGRMHPQATARLQAEWTPGIAREDGRKRPDARPEKRAHSKK